MDTNQTKQGKELLPEEEREMRAGSALMEMEANSEGWRIIKQWFEDMMFHSWVDPREIEGDNPEQVWKWRELNAFHAANNAKEVLEKVQKAISRSEYLQKVKSGEIDQKRFKI